MGLPVLRTPAAGQDLLAIWQYIARESERAADGVLNRFEQLLRMVSENPLAGRARPELGPGLRSLAVGSYVLFYEARPDAILLVRALHGSLDFDSSDFA